MKILFSDIEKLVPGLKVKARDVAEQLTMSGLMATSVEQLKMNGKKDYLIDLEVRQNRGDCLSILGIAREVAALNNLSVAMPVINNLEFATGNLNIKVHAGHSLIRLKAVQLNNLKNSNSPDWLKSWLEAYGLNSINLLVDISNYVMLMTAYPSHLIDVDKITGNLSWTLDHSHKKFTSLDKSIFDLSGDELIIEDKENVVALAGIVGGQTAAIDEGSTNIIVEMALYDPALIGRNARFLSVVTEAANRLTKDLSADSLNYAFELLLSLLLEHGHGSICSEVFEYYPRLQKQFNIEMDLSKPSMLAGVEIDEYKIKQILQALRCKVENTNNSNKIMITPPLDRTDLEVGEDIAEEIIRIFGFAKIPHDQAPAFMHTPNITPASWILKEKFRDQLSGRGWDETISPPLVSVDLNQATNWQKWTSIITQNSVNEEQPELRQSIASGLLKQLDEYRKKNVKPIRIFEFGKVFGKLKNYSEHDALGMLSDSGNYSDLVREVQSILHSAGAKTEVVLSQNSPKCSNPLVCCELLAGGQTIAMIYKLAPEYGTAYFAEVDLGVFYDLSLNNNSATVELEEKLVSLDANVEVASIQDLNQSIARANKLSAENYWSMSVVDSFSLGDYTRYTIRAVYRGLDDETAKSLHLKIFNLK